MTSGRKLTQEQVDRILELVGLEDEDGEYRLTLACIATQMGVSRRTIYRITRRAAAAWGQHTRWKPDQSTC